MSCPVFFTGLRPSLDHLVLRARSESHEAFDGSEGWSWVVIHWTTGVAREKVISLSSRTSWIFFLLGALALVGVVLLIIDDASGKAATSDRQKGRSEEPAPGIAAKAAASRPGSDERAITPRRTAESEPARTVEIEVARASGVPIADVSVVVFRDEAVLLSAKTDRAGLVRLAASSGDAHAVAIVPGYRLIEARISMEDERTRLVVQDGLEISGVVRVDGRVPKSTVKLSLWRSDDSDTFDVDLPNAVREALNYRNEPPTWLAETADEGNFRFLGLPSGFKGTINVDLPYHVRAARDGSQRALNVSAPARDVLVEAGRYAEISGRVVDAATRAPIGGAIMSANWSATTASSGLGRTVEDDGRFKFTVQADGVTAITITASAGPGMESATTEIADRFDEDHDVGDIAVNTGRLVHVVVRDEARKPVGGAIVQPGWSGNEILGAVAAFAARGSPQRGTRRGCSEPTDAEGRTTLRLTHEATTIQVAALGYEVAKFDVPAELSGSIGVTLRGDTLLTVRIVRGAAPAPRMLVKVKKTRRHFLPGSSIAIGGPDEPLIAAGMSTPVSWLVMEPFDRFEAGADGVVRLAGSSARRTRFASRSPTLQARRSSRRTSSSRRESAARSW